MKHFILFTAAFLLAGCATNTGDATKDRRAAVTNEVLRGVVRFLTEPTEPLSVEDSIFGPRETIALESK